MGWNERTRSAEVASRLQRAVVTEAVHSAPDGTGSPTSAARTDEAVRWRQQFGSDGGIARGRFGFAWRQIRPRLERNPSPACNRRSGVDGLDIIGRDGRIIGFVASTRRHQRGDCNCDRGEPASVRLDAVRAETCGMDHGQRLPRALADDTTPCARAEQRVTESGGLGRFERG